MSSNINEYVGKTFSYMLGIQNIVCVVVVLGFEKKGERFDVDSYYGKRILISDIKAYDNEGDEVKSTYNESKVAEYIKKYLTE